MHTAAGEGKMYVTLLVQLCELVAPLVFTLRTNMGNANLISYIL